MLCKEIMKTDVECCSPDDNLLEAARTMRDENVGFVPVCGDDDRILGTLTDRDIVVRAIANERSFQDPVSSCMSTELVSCAPDDDVRKAEELMASQRKSRILCCDEEGRLVGVISLSDIAQREDECQVGQVLRRVTERESALSTH